ncbi:MAG: Hsp20/alpha crystallin family protein [Desulfobacterales bacterium]|nr:Hsp20/alpha crystallin family protein [Desulfobacterales bacterium]
MPGLIIWKDQEINRMKKDMERLLSKLRNDFGMPLFSRTDKSAHFIQLSETQDYLIAEAQVPDIDPENLEISITDELLTIKGEVKREHVRQEKNYNSIERRRDTFSRTIKLPCRVKIEDVEATYQEGVLNISMPKCKPEIARGVKVKIK